MIEVAGRKCIGERTYVLNGWAKLTSRGQIAISEIRVRDENSNLPVPTSVLTVERQRFIDALIHNAECRMRNK